MDKPTNNNTPNDHESCCRHRRLFLLSPFVLASPTLLAQSTPQQGIVNLNGSVFVNHKPASMGQTIAAGDHITTSHNSHVTIITAGNVYHLRALTDVEFDSGGKAADVLRLITGKLLAVFGGGRHRLYTPHATMGIRGSAFYADVASSQTYYCTCYGHSTITAHGPKSSRPTDTAKATHHSARIIRKTGSAMEIVNSTMEGHTDQELTDLEARVDRKPAFL